MIERYAERHQEARERVKDLGRVFRITVAAGPVKWLASDRGCPISANLAQLREDLCLILTAGEHYDGNREAPYKMPVRYITGFIKGQLQRNPNDAFVGETLDYMLSTIVNGSVLYDLISYPNVQRAISDMHNPESDEMRQNAINATEAFIGMGLVWDGLSQPGIEVPVAMQDTMTIIQSQLRTSGLYDESGINYEALLATYNVWHSYEYPQDNNFDQNETKILTSQ